MEEFGKFYSFKVSKSPLNTVARVPRTAETVGIKEVNSSK